MPKSRFNSGIAALALLAVTGAAGPATAQSVRDLSVEQTEAYQAGATNPGSLWLVTILDRADSTYAEGERVRLAVKANEDAYLTVLNIGVSGHVTQLFPNRFQPDNRVKAGETLDVPSAASGAAIQVTGPFGAELIKVIATSKPLAVIPNAQLLAGGGPFSTLEGGVQVLKRDLEVASSNPPPEIRTAIVNQVIKTVPTRLVASSSDAAIVPVAASGQDGDLPVVGVPAQGFPLLLATDKATYRVGERITMAVTSLQACHLQVIARGARGRTRPLFPSTALTSDQVGALQTLLVSGGPSPQTLVAHTAGQETILALCTDDARAASARSVGEEMSGDEEAALDWDLARIKAHSGNMAGFAELALTITP